MALTNARPLQIPALENDALHNSASPVFQPSSLRSSSQSASVESFSDRSNSSMTSDTSESPSETPLTRKGLLALKRSATSSPLPNTGPTSELSRLVPVTGQRPKPTKKDLAMDDDILLAIFIILYERDPDQVGVTVKQLCDYLVDKHPDMAGASTKLSNLISAKLNAYVKKVEKGEKTLKYALSRQWSEGSPRRMVYVYRGVLAPDYKSHTQSLSNHRQESKQKAGKSNSGGSKKGNTSQAPDTGLEASAAESKGLSQTSRSINVSSNTFTISSFGSDFNIPYAASPVTMRLIPSMALTLPEEDALSKAAKERRPKSQVQEPLNKKPHLSAASSVPVYVTAAAAAPRLSNLASKKVIGLHDPLSASAHKLYTPLKPAEEITSKSEYPMEPCIVGSTCDSWLQTVQSGFLLEDIDTPEAVSLEDLDTLLN